MSPLWTRREVVAAVGTGIAAAACGNADTGEKRERVASAAGTDPNVSIEIYGPFVLKRHTGFAEVFMPMARANGTHSDGTPAKAHHPHLAFFDRKEGTALKRPAYPLTRRGLMLRGSQPATDEESDLGDLIKLKDVLPRDAYLRDYRGTDSTACACRIYLYGGRLAPIVDEQVGEWWIPDSFNRRAPASIKPVIGLRWDALQPEVELEPRGLGGPIPATLTMAKYPVIVIAHATMSPEAWWPTVRPYPKPGQEDCDFKWIYKIYNRDGKEDQADPWADEKKLPAPICKAVRPYTPDADRARPRAVGSSTCFGGEG